VALAVATALLVPLPARLSERPSTLVRFADDSVAHVFLAPDERWRIRADLERIDPRYVEALLAFEDARFFMHPGVDPLAILRAIGSNLRAGRVVSGASTITMQLVRLVEPRPRHLGSKITEALRALQLELRLSKAEILAHYLTFTPYGGNLEGIEAASWAYFGHSAEALAPDEIVVLLAVPQRPRQRAASPHNAARLEQARDEIAARLVGAEALHPGDDESPADLLSRIASSPPPATLRPMPREMPHLARWLADRSPELDEIPTTIDRGQQRLAERILHGARTELRDRGIHNGAAVVVDHRDGRVRAVVGNLDFWDHRHGGQIPAFSIPRSPGSALKPFLFALAIDRGIALPEHLVPDIPSAWGGWRPENADGEFHGLVSLGGALSTSLNVPFIRLLGEVGVEPFLALLAAGGAAGLDADPARLGLSAAIGGAEVSPLEVAALYTTLARGGSALPLRLLRTDQPDAPEPRQVLSPGATWLTRRVLARRDRPDFPARRELSGAPAQIHWKTGTSWGRRDAWAAGSGPTHTAVVWLGNVDATPSADLVGADTAAPLLFDLLEALHPGRPPHSTGPPADLVPVESCAWSGYLPSPACPTRREILALRTQVPTKTCPYHVAVDVDLERGLALNPSCRGNRPWQTSFFLQLPTTVARFLSERHRSLPAPPNLAPECLAAGGGRPPTILTPPSGQVIVLVRGLPDDRQEVPLEAESPRPGGRLSWWIDGRWLGTVVPPERLWWTPEPGEHELTVIDESGAATRRRVQVVRR
jgi:penicillin-binding protein 1C